MVDTDTELESINIPDVTGDKIIHYLPHRYPFIMVDLVKDIHENKGAVGVKLVSGNEPFFQGHFPDNPIMPGVLILEAMAQTMVVATNALRLAQAQASGDAAKNRGSLFVFAGVDKASFRRPVRPGDCLELYMKKVRVRHPLYIYEGRAEVNGVLCASAVLKCAESNL